MAENPFQSVHHFVQQYRAYIYETLFARTLNPVDIDTILETLPISSDIYISRNPRYSRSKQEFADFVAEYGLSDALNRAFPRFGNVPPYEHQIQGITSILRGKHTVISTGTGSGKTETFLVPIIGYALQNRDPGVKGLLLYPMNALASDQVERIGKAISDSGSDLTFGLYIGDTPDSPDPDLPPRYAQQINSRDEMRQNPPDILITNYTMLDRMLTRAADEKLWSLSASTLRYIVLDELHSYNGSKATDVKYLLARLAARLNHAPHYIATSATLFSDDIARKNLEHYLESLFNIESGSYEIVTAVEEQIPDSQVFVLPIQTELDQISFYSLPEALRSLKILTGKQVSESEIFADPTDGSFEATTLYQTLQHNPIVVAMQQALRKSAQTLSSLALHVAQELKLNTTDLDPKTLVITYLQALHYVQEKGTEKASPILDYRLHVFLRDQQGFLYTCPHCGRYDSGGAERCRFDHHILFPVYRRNIGWMMAKGVGQSLRAIVEPESTDVKNVYYVLLARVGDTVDAQFTLVGNLDDDGSFQIAEDGTYHAALLTYTSYEQAEQDLLSLSHEGRDYHYLYGLVKNLLRLYRKGLGFCDNRELASRYSTILRDEITSDFFWQLLRVYGWDKDVDVQKMCLWIEKQIRDAIQPGDAPPKAIDAHLLQEFALWYYRALSIPQRLSSSPGQRVLREDYAQRDDLQRELLNIFVREGAISRTYEEMGRSQFIRFQTWWATHPYGIYVEDAPSKHPEYRGLSLRENAVLHREFITRWKAPAILGAVHQLVNEDILEECHIPEEDTVYYLLRPQAVRWQFDEPSAEEAEQGYEELRKQFFVVDLHSSDVQAARRADVEKKLRDSEIQFVISTPTLEMGIDIGDLQCVLMIGAAPSPANYAQRAGRAGRGAQHEALIVTFCRGDDPHDDYAFQQPLKMINGSVEPPRLNPQSERLMQKHLNAFVLPAVLFPRRSNPEAALSEAMKRWPHLREQAQAIFGRWFPYDAYEGALPQLVKRASQLAPHTSMKPLYDSGLFPDYQFRRNQVIAIDSEQRDRLTPNPMSWRDYALTTRDDEQALRFFTPHQTIYLAGDVYKTMADGVYTLSAIDQARLYECIYVEREVRFARRSKLLRQLNIRREIHANDGSLIDKGGVLAVGYFADCLITARNDGVKQADNETENEEDPAPETEQAEQREASSKAEAYPSFGYDLMREVLLLRFDQTVSNTQQRHSLLAILLHAIEAQYGLAPGELRVISEVSLPGDKDKRWCYAAFYDNDGHSNLPMRRMIDDFDLLLEHASDRLERCACTTDGCYHCLEGYHTKYLQVSRVAALMFTGYLLHRNPFEPSIEPFDAPQTEADLTFHILRKGDEVVVQSVAHIYRQPVGDDLNTALFDALCQALEREYTPGMRFLCVTTPMDWLVNTLRERSTRKGRAAFQRLQFALLPFERVDAVKATL